MSAVNAPKLSTLETLPACDESSVLSWDPSDEETDAYGELSPSWAIQSVADQFLFEEEDTEPTLPVKCAHLRDISEEATTVEDLPQIGFWRD